MNINLHEETLAAIKRRLAASKVQQARKGVTINLSDDEHSELWQAAPEKLKRFDKAMRKAVRNDLDVTKVKMYVLTWVSYAAKQTRVMTRDNACIASHRESMRNCLMKKGDTHPESGIDRIRQARLGTTQTAAIRDAISETLSGVGKTDEHRKNMAEAACRRWAKKREQQVNRVG